jgi:hypothetical protein
MLLYTGYLEFQLDTGGSSVYGVLIEVQIRDGTFELILAEEFDMLG